jgi:hypothetical protein
MSVPNAPRLREHTSEDVIQFTAFKLSEADVALTIFIKMADNRGVQGPYLGDRTAERSNKRATCLRSTIQCSCSAPLRGLKIASDENEFGTRERIL